jgi:hypothetical protein
MNKSEVAKLVAMLKVHADHNQHGPELVDMWTIALEDMPAEAMMVAYKHWIKTHKWFPKPVELIGIANEKVFGIPSPETARVQVERSLKENYPGHPVKYEPDPLVIEALRTIGGTHVLRNAQSGRELDMLWQRFAFVYTELRAERLDTIDYAAEYTALASGDERHIRQLDNGERRAS